MRITRNFIGIILLVCLVLLGIAAVASSAGGVDDDDVATVDDAGDISKSEFNHWFAIIASQPQPGQKKKAVPPKPGTKEYDTIKQQVMSFLVSSKWIEGEAKARGVSATPEEVQRQFKQVKDQSFPNEKAYQRLLKRSGQTEQDLLFRVKSDVLANKVREKVTAGSTDVSDARRAERTTTTNKSQFEQPERRDVEVVKTKTQAQAQEALKRVKGGESFKKVAKDLSIDPASKNQDGRLIAVSKGQQEGAFDAALFAGVKNKIAGPIKTDTGYYVFRVTKITPGTKQSFDAVQAGHQAAARLAEPAEEARQLLDQLPQRVARQHRLRDRLRDPGLPQRPAADARGSGPDRQAAGEGLERRGAARARRHRRAAGRRSTRAAR